LFIIGQTYSRFDQKKAVQAYEEAYALVRSAKPEELGRLMFLVPELMDRTVQLAPEYVEQALPGQPVFRDYALASLTRKFIANKQLNRATETFTRIQSDSVLADVGRDLLNAIPTSRRAERDRIFRIVLDAYSSNTHPQIGTGTPEDLGTLVVRFWRDLSPVLVRTAIDVLLKQADPEQAGNDNSPAEGIVMTTKAGTTSFTAYQFRLFQLLPILKVLDPSAAESLLRNNPTVENLFKKYPAGQQSVDNTLTASGASKDEVSQVQYAYASEQSEPATRTGMTISSLSDQLAGDADRDPYSAIENASSVKDESVRSNILLGIAQKLEEKNPSAAKAAIRALLKTPPRSTTAWNQLAQAAELADRMHDTMLTQEAIKDALVSAQRQFQEDANPDHTNRALKLYWPSVRAYQEIIAIQSSYSIDEALKTISDLDDREVAALEKALLAAHLARVRLSQTSPVVAKNTD
jgi:hypothetical protein